MHASNVEIEGDYRYRVEQVLDEAFGACACHGARKSMDTVQQL